MISGFLYKKVAATYSPTWWGSTIGASELNFSVRNGKRWILTAITATIYVLRKNNLIVINFRVFRCRLCTSWLISSVFISDVCLNRSHIIEKTSQRKMSGY